MVGMIFLLSEKLPSITLSWLKYAVVTRLFCVKIHRKLVQFILGEIQKVELKKVEQEHGLSQLPFGQSLLSQKMFLSWVIDLQIWTL